MQCKKAVEFISMYVDGELDGSDASKLEQHVEHCCQCHHEMNQIREAKRAIASRYQCAAAPDHLRAEIACAISRDEEKKPWYSALFSPLKPLFGKRSFAR